MSTAEQVNSTPDVAALSADKAFQDSLRDPTHPQREANLAIWEKAHGGSGAGGQAQPPEKGSRQSTVHNALAALITAGMVVRIGGDLVLRG